MLEWLKTLLESWLGHIVPFVIIDPYQNGGVIRLGTYYRTLGPGIHWKIPFADDVNTQNVSLTTMRLPQQSLTTKDNVSIVVGAIVRFTIKDIKPYICDVTDQKDVLIDVTMGAIRKQVMEHSWDELRADPPEKEVATAVRRRSGRYGFDIEEVTFYDFAKARSFRLVQPHALNLDN